MINILIWRIQIIIVYRKHLFIQIQLQNVEKITKLQKNRLELSFLCTRIKKQTGTKTLKLLSNS